MNEIQEMRREGLTICVASSLIAGVDSTLATTAKRRSASRAAQSEQTCGCATPVRARRSRATERGDRR